MHTPDQHQHDSDEALEAPPQLVSALKCLPQERIFIPPTADEAVLRTARRQLERPARLRLGWLRLMPWVAAAAAVALLVAVPRFLKQSTPRPASYAAVARGDLNQDGHVDILDAFTLARQLRQGATRNLQLDVNGDGVVDERDVGALAALAVKLDRRERL